jgi:hypothetical protein
MTRARSAGRCDRPRTVSVPPPPGAGVRRRLRGRCAGEPVSCTEIGVLELGQARTRARPVKPLVENESLAVVVDLRPHLGEPIGALLT